MKNVLFDNVFQLPPISDRLQKMTAQNAFVGTHDELAQMVRALDLIEYSPSPRTAKSSAEPVRVAAWNLERCKDVDAAAALLSKTGSSVILLSEMDYGMARSGNRNTTRDLASLLVAQYAFAVEFVELGLGNPVEEVIFRGLANRQGFHGNAIISQFGLSNPCAVRLDQGAVWFDLDWHHPRLGYRNAIAAMVTIANKEVLVASAHFENLSTADGRAEQARRLIHELERHAGGRPIIIGGDFNTAALPSASDSGDADRDWFAAPETIEPLFTVFKSEGFGWVDANTPEQTRRLIDDGRPTPAYNRLDWFFIRGASASNPKTWPAQGIDDRALSDHELITVDISFGCP